MRKKELLKNKFLLLFNKRFFLLFLKGMADTFNIHEKTAYAENQNDLNQSILVSVFHLGRNNEKYQ